MSSLYDREAHRKWLRSALGEDLFLTKRGLERQSYRGPYFLGMLHDSHHQAAAQVLEAFEGKYVPVGARGNADVWFRHGFIRPSASAISTAKSVYVKPSLGLVVPNECIPARLLLDHVLGRQSLLFNHSGSTANVFV